MEYLQQSSCFKNLIMAKHGVEWTKMEVESLTKRTDVKTNHI